ncbi:MAG: hypothetical protein GQ570_10485 [Helicobacteraceae bacterium]|nr:hypothetical protein [Helicobacteraceae bacterium]
MYIKLTLLVATILTFTSCSKTNAFTYFSISNESEKAISSLQSATIKDNKKTTVIFSAININTVTDKREDYENFLISIYLEDKDYSEELMSKSLTLNSKAPLVVQELDENSTLLKLMPIKNRWSRYYEVMFTSEKSEKLNLIYQTYDKKMASLTFQKEN